MSQPELISQQTVKVPRSCLAEVPHRLSFDNGASLSKILFVTDAGSEHFELNLLTVRNDKFADTIRWIKSSGRCLLKGDGSDIVKMTGANYAFKELFQEQFQARCDHVIELLTQVRGCHWLLTNLPAEQLLLPSESPEPQFAVKVQNQLIENIAASMSSKDEASSSSSTTTASSLPALLCQIGSGSMLSVLSSSGAMQSFHFNLFGAKSLLGMSQLMLGTANYDELFALAEGGQRSRVDLLLGDVFGDDPNGPYGQFDTSLPMMHFGKAAEGKLPADGANREDVARSLVSLFCWNLFGSVATICRTTGVQQVYFSGNFFMHKVARVEFENARSLLQMTASFKHHFLRHGGHVGAVGALVATNADAPAYLKFA